jgi:isopentenyl diphosphate isomerase/L-lactate dehydrogenase-like FMN-dependent dehydrogenase
MQKGLLIIGVLLVVAGLLVTTGNMKYRDTDKVADFGAVEIEATRDKKAPLNWGYALIGAGALVLVGGAVARRR